MLSYLPELIIKDEKVNNQHAYSIPFFEMVESVDSSNGWRTLSPVFKSNKFTLVKNHTVNELEKKFSEIVLDLKEDYCINKIESNALKGDFFDVINNKYNLDDVQILLPKRIIIWSNYLHSKMRIEFRNLIVHPDLYDLIQVQLEVNSQSRISLYKNQHLPKEKIVFLSNKKDNGCFTYVCDDDFNDIILSNNNMVSIVSLISIEDIRNQKIDKLFE